MIPRSPRRRWPSPPLAIQIVALLLGGIIVTQLVTLGLTLLLPPAPPPRHSLDDIAAGLRGGAMTTQNARPLLRATDSQPPSLKSPGWFVSDSAQADLTRRLKADPADVRLLFYAPPPFAGSPIGPQPGPAAGLSDVLQGVLSSPAHAQPMRTRPPGPPQSLPPGLPPNAYGRLTHGPGGLPQAFMRPGPNRPAVMRPPWVGQFASGGPRMPAVPMRPEPAMVRGLGPIGPMHAGGLAAAPVSRVQHRFVFHAPLAGPPPKLFVPSSQEAEPVVAAVAVETASLAETIAAQPPVTEPVALPTLKGPAPATTVTPVAVQQPDAGRPIVAPQARGLFGLTPPRPAFIEGDFIAAYRVAPGRWITLRTQPEAFPNSWQRRVMLWLVVSFAIVAPLGWIFAQRLAAPLTDFARAAERLGREPTAQVVAQEGPAEVGQAARAFNQMQARLKRYVEDRTGMIGAISHDLRTPLARLRFRIERASPALRREMAGDLDQMEAMITSVLTFMRDNAQASARQRVDLRSVLECAVDDAEVVGARVSLEPGAPAEVEVDVLGVQRVFANLIDNAIKYGHQANVRLFAERGEIIAEITDQGPGLDDSELERVFLPFYRAPEARASARQGVGLGLSVSRTTIRAHGGDIRLRRGQTGLVAQVRLPLAVNGAS